MSEWELSTLPAFSPRTVSFLAAISRNLLPARFADGSKQQMTTAVSDKVMKFNLINLRLYAGL